VPCYKVQFDNLIWDGFNTSHIATHKVRVHEIEVLLKNRGLKFLSAKNGRFFALSKAGKRLLTVVIAKERGNKFYVVTARDMGKEESKYYRNEKNK
jgi:uncharacterized DUF497 family protein